MSEKRRLEQQWMPRAKEIFRVIIGTLAIGLQPRSKEVKMHAVMPAEHQKREFEC